MLDGMTEEQYLAKLKEVVLALVRNGLGCCVFPFCLVLLLLSRVTISLLQNDLNYAQIHDKVNVLELQTYVCYLQQFVPQSIL